MFTGLQRGLVFKSKTDEKGQTAYTLILGRKFLFPWMYKTATIYKDWTNDCSNLELPINKSYSIKEIKKRNLASLDEEEELALNKDIEKLPKEQREYLRRNIENLPEKVRNTIYNALNLELFPDTNNKALYGFEMQNISKTNSNRENNLEVLSKNLSQKFYKKALSITQILPL